MASGERDGAAEAGPKRSGRLQFRLVAELPDGREVVRTAHVAPVSIGRSRDCDIRIEEVKVSRRHCVVFYRAGALYLQDQGSSNGTFVNDMRMTQARLAHGDVIAVGSVRIRVEALGLAAPASAAGSGSRAPASAEGSPDPEGGSPSRRQISIVTRLGALLAAPEDMVAAAEAALDLLLEAMPVERAFVVMAEELEEDGPLPVLASRTRAGTDPSGAGPSRLVVERVLAAGEPFHSLDVAGDPALSGAASPKHWQIGAVLSAPLVYRNRVDGVLYADSRAGVEGLHDDALSLFEAIAVQTALAVGRAREHAELLDRADALRQERDHLAALSTRLEEKLRRRTIELEDHQVELAVRSSELELVREARVAMASDVLIDARRGVRGIEEGLEPLDALAEAARSVGRARYHAERLLATVEDALDAVRFEEGRLGLESEPVRVGDVLGVAAARAAGPAEVWEAEVEVGALPSGLSVLADPRVLARVMDGVVASALPFARRGRLVLAARQRGSSAELVVTERGPASAAADRERLLARWSEAEHRGARSLGAALHYCRLAAEAHGGRLTLSGDATSLRWVLSLPAIREGDADVTMT